MSGARALRASRPDEGVRVRFVNAGGRASLLVDDQVFDLAEATNDRIPSDPLTVVVSHWDAARELATTGLSAGGRSVADVELRSPIPAPGCVFAIGMNYRTHAREVGRAATAIPAVFTKFPSSVTGPYADIVLPAGEETTDFEAELAVVVGMIGHNVRAAEALDTLRGFMVSQDISERFVQMNAGGQFSLGKSFDTFCPLGPAIVTLDELDDPGDLRITCRVNGELMQDETTADMIIDVPHVIELLSSVVTLRPGDVCLTGTPSGVGFSRRPPIYLHDGDVVETEITGLGTMRNRCILDERG